jgi:alcohol dehydrogenase class IV
MEVDCAILPQPARDAMNQHCLLINNPLPATEADALDIYTAAS